MDILDIAIAKQLAGGGGGSGTDNYNDLSNLPKINDVTLSGNKSSSALGLQSEITSENKLDSDLIDDTNQDNKFVTSIEKNTWNAKQNAIDADHKLSSSLVSFTTAEAAALASGIDSSKVGQISTNQTNILSVEDMITDKEFDSTKSYSIGDVVTYEHKLYKFKAAHSGAWSTSDVDQITVIAYVDDHSGGGGGDVSSIKVGSTPYYPDSSGIVGLPAYPTSLPANGGTASNVSGTVAIANGGTGATSASGARTNLGLGSAATRSYTSSVTSGSTSLVTSGAVYSAIEYLTPSLKSKRHVCTTTDYEQCADVAITVPANKTIQYTANLKFNNAPPRGVQVRTGTDLSNLNQVVGIQETTQNYSNLSVTGLYTNTSSSPVILYVYVKSNAVTSGGNDVVTNVFRLN